MRLIIGMGKGSTSDEIMDYFDLNTDILPSLSAFVQRRSQISLSAFQFLFSEFSSSFPETTHQFKDHCILAFDGCHVVYATNAEIIEDYNVPRLVDYKGYNHMHLNGFVDVIFQCELKNLGYVFRIKAPSSGKCILTSYRDQLPDDQDEFNITIERFFTDKYSNIMKQQKSVGN